METLGKLLTGRTKLISPKQSETRRLAARGLALVRLGGEGEAAEAVLRAVNALPEVRRYLMRERAAQPPLDPRWVTFGGKDQAWLYRDAMRDLWLRHP